MTYTAKDLDKVPQLRGEYLYIPFVGAIIERELNGVKQILVQIRHKETDSKYKDVIEIPGGKFRAFEDVYETLRREVKEESGLDITFVDGEKERVSFKNRDDDSDIVTPFCVTQMKNGPFIGLIFLCKGEGELAKSTNWQEAKRFFGHAPQAQPDPFRKPDRPGPLHSLALHTGPGKRGAVA